MSPAVITDFLLPELEAQFRQRKAPVFYARQVLLWLYRHRAKSFEVMTDLPKELRTQLAARYRLCSSRVKERHRSPDGTVKFLLELEDGNLIETVLIPDGARTTICVSTQVGCPIRCGFCASGMEGVKRNLRTAEIVEQVLQVHYTLTVGERANNLVVMGIGEPLLNFDALVKALKIFNASWGMGFGYNKITLSTVGTLLDRLKKMREMKIVPNLALSLHAPNDALRRQFIPTLKVSVDEIIRAGVEYKEATRKNVTFEYVLLRDVNDSPEHARELAARVRGTKCKVNVIPYNRVNGLPYVEPSKESLDTFVATLGNGGVPVTVRQRKGDNISAACGQLRAQFFSAGVTAK